MSRLTDEELTEAFAYAHGSLRLTAALSELKERRRMDDNLRRLSDVVRGYHNRNGRAPTSTTLDLCDAVDDLLAGKDGGRE